MDPLTESFTTFGSDLAISWDATGLFNVSTPIPTKLTNTDDFVLIVMSGVRMATVSAFIHPDLEVVVGAGFEPAKA